MTALSSSFGIWLAPGWHRRCLVPLQLRVKRLAQIVLARFARLQQAIDALKCTGAKPGIHNIKVLFLSTHRIAFG